MAGDNRFYGLMLLRSCDKNVLVMLMTAAHDNLPPPLSYGRAFAPRQGRRPEAVYGQREARCQAVARSGYGTRICGSAAAGQTLHGTAASRFEPALPEEG